MWGDFRTLDPKHMISVFPQHPQTRFDLYHMGMPWVRETGIIGKNFPNVWLNLCWCHIISPKMTCSALDEWIDLVPMNKIIGFGGDYGRPVEKVYGHLLMVRENIATSAKYLTAWTPSEVAKSSMRCWGREYLFSASGSPLRIAVRHDKANDCLIFSYFYAILITGQNSSFVL